MLTYALLSTAFVRPATMCRVAAPLGRRPFVHGRDSHMQLLPDHIETLKEELESGEAQLFDVREPGEWAAGRLSQAVHVPLSDLQDGIVPSHDKEMLTYLHCAAGVRVRPLAHDSP